MMSYASSIGTRSSLFKIQAIQMDKLNTAIPREGLLVIDSSFPISDGQKS